MSTTLNDSDFQCLQEQMVQLKTSHYELADKYRKKSADFEAAMLKVHFLQKQLEEQERDFEITSTTLRREIESVTGEISNKQTNNNKEEDYKSRYKKLLHKAKELQQRYEKSVEIVQQLDEQNKELNEKVSKLEADNVKIKEEYEVQLKSRSTDEELSKQYRKSMELVQQLESENKNLQQLVSKFEEEGSKVKQETELRFESLAEQRKIQERKGLQIVKELKRQLALEKNRTETLQQRIENLLKEHPIINTPSNTSEPDANSVGSWSFVPIKTATKSDLSLCSIENSEDRETVQKPCDTEAGSEIAESLQRQQTDQSAAATTTTTTSISDNSPVILRDERSSGKQKNLSSSSYPPSHSTTNSEAGMLIEEQAALVDRLTKLQHDKWMLEEKLSYMEQANSSLSEDLANKSDIIKQYFMDQAMKVNSNTASHQSPILQFNAGSNSGGRRTSFPNNMNHMLSDKPSLKRVVDFLKERSQVSSHESENLSREATKKMQLMLEETLIKCLELQKNLDFVTSELNKLKS